MALKISRVEAGGGEWIGEMTMEAGVAIDRREAASVLSMVVCLLGCMSRSCRWDALIASEDPSSSSH